MAADHLSPTPVPGSKPRSAAERARGQETAASCALTDRRASAARLAQLSALANSTASASAAQPTAPNSTGLPDGLKRGVEQLSGQSLDHVRVHRNSAEPAQLNAHAFARGADIHLAPGQEKHLPHEAWHVVQQAQGRVKPTTQAAGQAVNDDRHLEREADAMASRALSRSEPRRARARPAASGSSPPAQLKYSNAPTDKDPQRKFDSYLGQYVHVVQTLDGFGGATWFLLEDLTSNRDQWIYEPPTDDLPERYSRFVGKESYENALERADADRAEQRYRTNQQKPTFAHPKVQASPKQIVAALEKGLAQINEFKRLDSNLAARVHVTFPVLIAEFQKGRLEPSPDLLKKINQTMEPLGKKQFGAVDAKRVSEALSELDYAAHIVSTVKLASPFVLGAQGPVWSPSQKEDIKPEDQHGQLPPLDIIRLEVDAYYMSADGVLHLDEVKDTPRALAQKAKTGDQIRRQVQWLKDPFFYPNQSKSVTKQVGYFSQALGPYFDEVLDETVMDNLALIDGAQHRGLPFIRIGPDAFTMTQLRQLYAAAIQWLEDSTPYFDSKKIRLSQAAVMFFGDLATARKTLQGPPKKIGDV